MKKHPVDDLFKRKLVSLEKNPSELAWERIREGQKNKSPRIAAWVWYAAASITLALISGYVVWQNQTSKFSGLSGNTEIAGVEKKMSELNVSPSQETDKKSIQPESLPDVFPERKKVLDPIETAQIKPEDKMAKIKYKLTAPKIEVRKIESAAPVQIAKAEPAKMDNIKLEKTGIQESLSPEKVSSKPIELAHLEEKKPDRTIVVEVEEPKNEFKDKKPSRLTRVFRQLKNVREAEPVDWNEVGFNPKDIIARADDRPNDNDEKVLEKRERKN